MKALHGFSPMSVVALLVAVVVVPIVLFPLGAALMTNLLFVYAYRKFRAANSEEAFRATFAASMLGILIFAALFVTAPFDSIYPFIRTSTFLEFGVRNQLPDNFELAMFKLNVFFALVGPGGYVFYICFKHAAKLCKFDNAHRISRRGMLALYLMLPIMIIGMILVQVSYFGDLQLGHRHKDNNEVLGGHMRELFVISLTFSVSVYTLLRTLIRNFLNQTES